MPAQRVGPRTILILKDTTEAATGVGLCARVSSHDEKAVLDRQVARLTAWAADVDGEVVRVEAAIVGTVVVERRDRLGRMNVELVEAALSAHGRRLVVLDDARWTTTW